ncbi:flavin reductase family protein [Streptomyces sp. WAC06614]|uniref:flavin reductase family protein n=1 Tax=Streptomyces sp. WAC06614 TaxID=2487416 RepID=UPI000F7913DA|nr:flavin reductase family protein [Streptomyces sp. WAC06614]RSS67490.1 flavin reductase [Streptomyces sp. WAC06614]
MPEPDLGAFAFAQDGPMYVVTAAADGLRGGCLVGFASQCSIEPPRFVVWLSVANHTYEVARRAHHLTVHVLREDQKALARLFGSHTGDRTDKFARTGWRPGREGTPVLDDVAHWFTGRIEAIVAGGDHEGFLLVPVDGSPPAPGPAGPPLRYGAVHDLSPGHPA